MPERNVFVGTAGWSYADWQDVVYPRAAAGDRLGTVSEFVDCVEIDSSFYRPPTSQMASSWLRSVADKPEFRFFAKAWQRFTHERASTWSAPEFELYVSGLRPLRDANRLDGILFQFPWSFRNVAVNRDWLQRIGESFADWPVIVEVRHDSWLEGDTEDFFRSQRFSYCNIDQPQLAHCMPAGERVTSDIGYFRLHGRNAKNWFREKQEKYGDRYDYLYSAAELDEVLTHVRGIAAKARKTFVILNNHLNAQSMANALQIKARLNLQSVTRAPAALLERYPLLRGELRSTGDEQLPLI